MKEGREEDFVRAWQDLADRTKTDFPDETATLLQDRDEPRQFISFGPWESLEQIEQWRGSDTFRQGVAKVREVLDEFAPSYDWKLWMHDRLKCATYSRFDQSTIPPVAAGGEGYANVEATP